MIVDEGFFKFQTRYGEPLHFRHRQGVINLLAIDALPLHQGPRARPVSPRFSPGSLYLTTFFFNTDLESAFRR